MRRWPLAVVLLVLAAAVAVPAQARLADRVSGTDYDTFDAVTLNQVDGTGHEIPYVGGPVQFNVGPFDTTGFTVQPGESGSVNNVNGCARPDGFDFAGRTAWVRFNPGVDGGIYVRAFTPGYDSVLAVRGSAEAPWHSTQLTDLPGHDVDCSNSTTGPGDEAVGYCAVPNPGCHRFPVKAGLVYFVQVGGKCPGGPDTCTDPSVPGGSTSIRLDFVPDDTDGDGVPDTLDACAATPADTPVNSAGCPDQDGDGIADADDDCVNQPGVPADPPYNGCPEGPVPPTPDGARLLILSKDDNPDNTSSTDVYLRLNWPKGALRAFANNGSGDPDVEVPLVGTPVPWQLRPATKSEARQVNVTYRGPGIDETATDIITLDPEDPTVANSLLLSSGNGWYVGLRLADKGSGVSRVRLLNGKKQVIAQQALCTKSQCALATQGRFTTNTTPRFVRVVDAAGNVRTAKISPRTEGCQIAVPESNHYTTTACFKIGDSCRPPKDTKYNWQSRRLRCTARYVVKRMK